MIERRVDGIEVHHRLPDPVEPFNATKPEEGHSDLVGRSDVPTLDIGGSYCGCGIHLNKADTDNANAALQYQVRNGKDMMSTYYSVSGSVVAFTCTNFFPADIPTLKEINVDISDACGMYVAGTVYALHEGGQAYAGYMNWHNGLDFCGNAASSNKHSC